jgi:integrase/recombinase XerD
MVARNCSVVSLPSAPVVTIFVRHSADCPHRENKFHKSCRCRKSLRFFNDGKQQTQSAHTRSWGQAETAKRNLEERFRGTNSAERIASVSVRIESRPTIDRAADLFISDKVSQGIDPTAEKKYKRELGRFSEFMAKRAKLFPMRSHCMI